MGRSGVAVVGGHDESPRVQRLLSLAVTVNNGLRCFVCICIWIISTTVRQASGRSHEGVAGLTPPSPHSQPGVRTGGRGRPAGHH